MDIALFFLLHFESLTPITPAYPGERRRQSMATQNGASIEKVEKSLRVAAPLTP
jgi:hypothetical protein